MTHLMCNGFVQGAPRLQFSFKAKRIVKHDNPVAGISCWAQVSITLNAVAAVVAVDFWDDKNVDVIFTIPGGQLFDCRLICGIVILIVSDAVQGITGYTVSIDTDDAIGGFPIRCASGHFKLNECVRPVAFFRLTIAIAKIIVHPFNGRQDLCVADVLIYAHW